MDENDENYNREIIPTRETIGRDVAIFRTLLNMTQQQFAETICSSRVTVNKLENTSDPSQISKDVAYRLYYITQKAINNKYFTEFTRKSASELQTRIEQEILFRNC